MSDRGAPVGGGEDHSSSHEHDDAGRAPSRLRELTHGYTPPADACNTFKAMLDSLRQLESDVLQHVQKENNILFPRAAAAEASRGTG